MKVVAFNGSARKDGNTSILIKTVLNVLNNEDIETELITLSGELIRGCTACYKCRKALNRQCDINDDIINKCIEKMDSAQGILLGSPTYFSNISAEMKALIDRCGMVAKVNGDMFKRKVGAGVVAVRRAGSIHTFNSLNHFFTISQMIIPGSSYWNVAIGREKGEVNSDQEGMNTMKVLGENMAWLLKKINA